MTFLFPEAGDTELEMLVRGFSYEDLAKLLRHIASRLTALPAADIEFEESPATMRQKPKQLVARADLQAIVHQAYTEAGFVVVDVPDGTVGILNASPQIVNVTNRIITLLVERFDHKETE